MHILYIVFCLQIRKQAIKDLPTLCKDNKEHTARIADILAQLLQAEDTSELAVVHNSIMSLMKSDPKGRNKLLEFNTIKILYELNVAFIQHH